MKLPRLTKIFTVDIYLKSGTVQRKEFLEFSWKYTGDEGITSLKWKTADGNHWFIDLNSIASINVISYRTRIRLR
jgi:hypothetical protein